MIKKQSARADGESSLERNPLQRVAAGVLRSRKFREARADHSQRPRGLIPRGAAPSGFSNRLMDGALETH